MAETPTRAGPTALGTASATLEQAGGTGTWLIVRSIIVTNVTGAANTVTLGVGTSNTDAVGKRIASALTVQPGETIEVLSPGSFVPLIGGSPADLIYGLCSVANGATVTVSGVEGAGVASTSAVAELGARLDAETVRWRSGHYYGTPSPATGQLDRGNGWIGASRLVVPAVTLDRIACEVTVAGSAGALIRLGIWADDGNGAPQNLILDAGTVDATTTGVKAITISQALAAQPVWLSASFQGNPTTTPFLRTFSGTVLEAAPVVPTNISNGIGFGFSFGPSGALPATWQATISLDLLDVMFRVVVRKA